MPLNTTFTSSVLTSGQMNNLPFGIVGVATSTTSTLNISTVTDLAGLTLTFTAIANRQYMATLMVQPYGTAGNSGDTFFNLDGTDRVTVRQGFAATNVIQTQMGQYFFTTTAGSHTLKLRMVKSTANNVNNYGDANFVSTLAIYDLGAR